MTVTRALIDRLKSRANDMAKPFIDAGQQPDATAAERPFGEAARDILRDAETRARLLPRAEFEQRVEAFTDWHRRQGAEIARLCGQELPDQPRAQLSEARRRVTAEFDHREAEFHEWVDSHALAAWIRATEDLLTLDRPFASIASQASPVRH